MSSAATTGDRVALRELVERYALAVDERRLADVAALFVADGVLAVPRPPVSMEPTIERIGREAIQTAMASLRRYATTMHAIVGHVVDLDDAERGRASGTTTCLAHHISRADDGVLTAVVWGVRYRDRYALDEGAWRFVRRDLSVDWTEEHPITAVQAR